MTGINTLRNNIREYRSKLSDEFTKDDFIIFCIKFFLHAVILLACLYVTIKKPMYIWYTINGILVGLIISLERTIENKDVEHIAITIYHFMNAAILWPLIILFGIYLIINESPKK
jgi:hypothetical protein